MKVRVIMFDSDSDQRVYQTERFDNRLPATKKPVALTIAGSDASGGAGIQADLKTFHQFGVYGEAAVTLITVQNTLGVQRVECLTPELVGDQIGAVICDLPT